MRSNAFRSWQTFGLSRLDAIEQQCLAPPHVPHVGLDDENLRAYVVLLSGHLQSFCRDLYSECVQALVAAVPLTAQLAIQKHAGVNVQLDRFNASYSSICQDFNRFGFTLNDQLDLDPAHAQRKRHILELNEWRNYCAHRNNSAPVNFGGPLAVPIVRAWQDSCGDFAAALDAVMYNQLHAVTASAPW